MSQSILALFVFYFQIAPKKPSLQSSCFLLYFYSSLNGLTSSCCIYTFINDPSYSTLPIYIQIFLYIYFITISDSMDLFFLYRYYQAMYKQNPSYLLLTFFSKVQLFFYTFYIFSLWMKILLFIKTHQRV